MNQELIDAIVGMREDEAIRIAEAWLAGGADPQAVLTASRQALEAIGRRYESRQAFLPELIMGGEIMKAVAARVKPRIGQEAEVSRRGRVLIGTVAGDIHDIGKDLVVFMLDVNGFEVYDLGVDVPPEVFVEKIRELKPQVVGLSALLTTAFETMKSTVEAIREAGLRDRVKIAIGGGTLDELLVGYTGADAYGADAMAAVELARRWTREV
ncbi:MAG: cobalamin-dependent protein [Proteobacteria bacterium]|nr:cobalamin-dependent protein [Pseudomonadota bacterium]